MISISVIPDSFMINLCPCYCCLTNQNMMVQNESDPLIISGQGPREAVLWARGLERQSCPEALISSKRGWWHLPLFFESQGFSVWVSHLSDLELPHNMASSEGKIPWGSLGLWLEGSRVPGKSYFFCDQLPESHSVTLSIAFGLTNHLTEGTEIPSLQDRNQKFTGMLSKCHGLLDWLL